MATKVIPAINDKWPQYHRNMAIKIQHDNAKPHRIKDTDPAIAAAYAQSELNMSLRFQPPNSPDMNILDLGFFNSLQSIQYKKHTNTKEELKAAVFEAFDEMTRVTTNKVFLTLQKVHEQTILHDGGNDFKLPHCRKAVLARQGLLPLSWTVSDELKEKIEQLQQPQQALNDPVVAAGGAGV